MTEKMTTYELAQKMVGVRSAELSDALVQQKNEILARICTATDSNELKPCLEFLNLVAPVWIACEYGYKVQELKARIIDRAKFLRDEGAKFLLGERKNSKVRASTEHERSSLLCLVVMLSK